MFKILLAVFLCIAYLSNHAESRSIYKDSSRNFGGYRKNFRGYDRDQMFEKDVSDEDVENALGPAESRDIESDYPPLPKGMTELSGLRGKDSFDQMLEEDVSDEDIKNAFDVLQRAVQKKDPFFLGFVKSITNGVRKLVRHFHRRPSRAEIIARIRQLG